MHEPISRLNTTECPLPYIGATAGSRDVLEQLRRAAAVDTPVVIVGEESSGKEHCASIIHYLSRRSVEPLVKRDCRDDTAHRGPFPRFRDELDTAPEPIVGAARGTLVVKNIDVLPRPAQSAVVAILEASDGDTHRLNRREGARIVATTAADLSELAGQGAFRQDLYYRLVVQTITLEPLRERVDDIEAFAAYFLERFCRNQRLPAKGMTERFLTICRAYSWPGNIDELRYCVEYAAANARSAKLRPEDLPANVREDSQPKEENWQLTELVADYERGIIERSLALCNGNMARSARLLGVSERLIGLRCRKYKINPRRFKD